MLRYLWRTVAMVAALFMALTSCTSSSSDAREQRATDKSAKHFSTTQPMHAYDFSQARASLIAAQDALAVGADSWTVQTVPGVGVTFACPSIGFPLPFGTQLTNPRKPSKSSGVTASKQKSHDPSDICRG